MNRSTVLMVTYGLSSIQLDWIPDDVDVVVVHNDDRLHPSSVRHPRARHLHPGRNLGFGAGMNLALSDVTTDRVILCNPDTRLAPLHFEALDNADDATIVAIPLVEDDGTPNAVVNPYWSVPAFFATAWRVGRFVPRDSRGRALAARLLGSNGGAHVEALAHRPGRWPLSERWVSGAVFSMPTASMRAVGGFDEDFFLYFEDAALQQRLARVDPSLMVELKAVAPARHAVGGSVGEAETRVVARHRRSSARTYASRQPGIGWRLAQASLAVGAR
jgi:N-acetylglucosaminyl-diphospho-decaprenol L-rhamnosyltransferase